MRAIKLLILGFVVLAFSSASALAAVDMSLQGPDSAAINTAFDITINLSGTEASGAVKVKVDFNTTLVEVTAVASTIPGAVVPSDMAKVNTDGFVTVSYASPTGFVPNDSPVFATISLTSKSAEGDAIFNLDEAISYVKTASFPPTTITGTVSDKTVSVQAQVGHAVSFNVNDVAMGSITGDNSQTVADGGDATAVTAEAAEGYRFVDWTGDVTSTDNPLTVANVTQPMTITANFQVIPTYTVAFAVNDSTLGSLTGTTSQTVAEGGNASAVEAVPADGASFTGWTGDFAGMNNPLSVTNVTKDMTITANFSTDTYYTVQFTAGANGTILGTLTQQVLEGGNATAVTAEAADGYRFVNWTSTGDFTSVDNPLTITNVTANMSITATFEQIVYHTITFQAGANGTLTGQTGQSIEAGGSTTAVTANANDGYKFDNWTGTGGFTSTANPLTVTNVTADMTITANFSEITTVQKGDADGDGSVTIFDALLIAQIDANLVDPPADITPLDVDCNNIVDIMDALRVAKFDVGLIDSLECPQ